LGDATSPPVTAGEIWSIGHEDLPVEQFIEMLQAHGITLVVDVRTVPYRKRRPQFDRERLVASLKAAGIGYQFLGYELGHLREDQALWGKYGRPDFEAIARTELYQAGLARLMALAAEQRTAFLGQQANPWRGQRERLIGRSLRAAGWRVHHILGDGSAREHRETTATGATPGA
jgi:uncharacterized protein (DUF488 family)